MLDQALLEQIVSEIVDRIQAGGSLDILPLPSQALPAAAADLSEDGLEDITSDRVRGIPLLKLPKDCENYDALIRMKSKTPARIGVGRAGPRLNTKTLLTLRADHALARDAVFTDVDPALLDRLGLFAVQSRCTDKNQHITRPDLGRQLDDNALTAIKSKCGTGKDVQIIVADGLSSKAIEANAERILPVLEDGLKAAGLKLGAPFFIKYGRVGVQDAVAEALGAKVVCILIGERPGLATAKSMSAYLCYDAKVGQPEARRTVVSNIHPGGIAAVEAGAYLVELIQTILAAKASGVDLKQAR